MNKCCVYISTFLLLLPTVVHAEAVSVTSADGNEITAEGFKAQGDSLFIWLPHESSPLSVDTKLARQVARLGIETWLVDLFNSNFLPVAPSSMDKIPAQQITDLIDSAYAQTHKKIYLLTSGRGVIPILRGARHWQQHHPGGQALAGVILLSPKLFIETPDPGLEGELMPIASVTNLPIYLLQSSLSPWFWKLPKVVTALEKSGSDVFIQRLDKVRDRFYFRPDAIDDEHALTKNLPRLLKQARWLLQQLPNKIRQPAAKQLTPPTVRTGKKDLRLQTYKGSPTPPSLVLKTLADEIMDLKQMRGQVVLVNFWASWCPPCVHEMPSMARLANQFKDKPFTILAVNMAENKQTIQHFINTRVKVNFPIVMDTDGAALRNWKVFAFPTSYLIDKQGTIRYAVFGSINWDTPQIVSTINRLIKDTE